MKFLCRPLISKGRDSPDPVHSTFSNRRTSKNHLAWYHFDSRILRKQIIKPDVFEDEARTLRPYNARPCRADPHRGGVWFCRRAFRSDVCPDPTQPSATRVQLAAWVPVWYYPNAGCRGCPCDITLMRDVVTPCLGARPVEEGLLILVRK